MKKRVLLIEDDVVIARLLRDNLESDGFVVAWSETGTDALALAKGFTPDLVVLDLMLPSGADGFALCRAFATARKPTPVIILTARGDKNDKVRGLSLGADDYMVKPFALEELLARIRVVLRRTTPPIERLSLGETIIDFRSLRAYSRSGDISLTDREFAVLKYLAEKAGSIASREELIQLVWGYAEAPTTRLVDNFIFRIRQKLEPDPHHPKYLRTAYGDGYRLTVSG
jgi:DNA-binding response OmpR family regulator